jgi:sugar phosphate isomerase/epimerase
MSTADGVTAGAVTPGLCSVTMRHLSVEEVARLASEAGLRAVEWGGDVHVPPGDRAAVRRAVTASDVAGLTCASYGSYLLADGDGAKETVLRVLDTAVALGAPNVRVWTPFGVDPGSPRTAEVVDALATVAALAAERDLRIGIEHHAHTLTATVASTLDLLAAVDAPNVSSYWQPPYWLPRRDPGADAVDVARLGGHLSHLHVYEWAGAEDRRPLADGDARWRAVLAALDGSPRVAFLEFVAGDDPRTLLADARTLHAWLGPA